MKYIFASALLVVLFFAPNKTFAQSAAQLCANMTESLQYQTPEQRRGSIPATRDICKNGARSKTFREYKRIEALQAQQNEETSNQIGSALLSFGIGFLEGYVGGGGFSRQSAPARTNHVSRGTSRTVNRTQRVAAPIRTTTVRSTPTVRTNTAVSTPVIRTTPVTNTVVHSNGANVQLNGNRSGVIGTVTQPSGVKDPIYSTPCRPQQTGPSSFNCAH